MRLFSNKLPHILTYWLPVLALCIAIYRQSSLPAIITQPLFPHADKAIHFVIYLLLAFLTARLITAETKMISIHAIRLIAIIFSSGFGLSDEIHQAFVPVRDASPADFAADVTGSIAGAFLYLDIFVKKKTRPFTKSNPNIISPNDGN